MWTKNLEFAFNRFHDVSLLESRKFSDCSLIFPEPSLQMNENVELSLEFPTNHFQDVPLTKFRKFPDSFYYIYQKMWIEV